MNAYNAGWRDCKTTIIELLHSFGEEFQPNFEFLSKEEVEKICSAIEAQAPDPYAAEAYSKPR